jgi:hypothetical protein
MSSKCPRQKEPVLSDHVLDMNSFEKDLFSYTNGLRVQTMSIGSVLWSMDWFDQVYGAKGISSSPAYSKV